MWQDPIVDEVRQARGEYSKRLNNDLKAIYQDIKGLEAKSGKKVVSFPPKQPKPLKV